jgi:hypothetical protein
LRTVRPHAAPASDAAPISQSRRATYSAPADFAFTHDPLTGSVTRHETSPAARPTMKCGIAQDATPIDDAYRAPERERPPLPATAPTRWSELEGSPVQDVRDTAGALARSIPTPAAVH